MFYEKVMNMVIEQHIQSPNLLIYKWTSPINGLLAAGPLIASGYGYFLAAAIASAGAITLATKQSERRSLQDKFPAAFFLKLK